MCRHDIDDHTVMKQLISIYEEKAQKKNYEASTGLLS